MSEFRCRPCGKRYPNKALFTRHLTSTSHTGIRLGCPHCPITFSRSDTLKAHVKGQHGDVVQENGKRTGGVVWKQPPRTSTRPDEELLENEDDNESEEVEDNEAIEVDQEGPSKKAKMFCTVCGDEHEGQHECQGPKKKLFNRHQCKICGKRMKHSQQLNGHMKVHKVKGQAIPPTSPPTEINQEENQIEIEVESEETYAEQEKKEVESGLKIKGVRHLTQGEQEKLIRFRPYQCGGCNKMYKTAEELAKHEEMHQGLKRRPSDIWTEPPEILEIFEEEEDLIADAEENENEENKQIEVIEEKKVKGKEGMGGKKKQAKCVHCRRTFGNSGALGFHMKIKHHAEYLKKQREEKLAASLIN